MCYRGIGDDSLQMLWNICLPWEYSLLYFGQISVPPQRFSISTEFRVYPTKTKQRDNATMTFVAIGVGPWGFRTVHNMK